MVSRGPDGMGMLGIVVVMVGAAMDGAPPKKRVILSFFRGGGLIAALSFGKEGDEDIVAVVSGVVEIKSFEVADEEEEEGRDDDDDDMSGSLESELSSIPKASAFSLSIKYTPSISTRLAWILGFLPLISLFFLF